MGTDNKLLINAASFCLFVLTALWSLCGCQPVSPQKIGGGAAPELETTVHYTSGATLSGPQLLDVNSLRIEDTYTAVIKLYAMECVPPRKLDSLQKKIRVVMMSPRPNVIAPVSRLTPGARIAMPDVNDVGFKTLTAGAWGPVTLAGEVTGLLPPNVTGIFDLRSDHEESVHGNQLRILVSRRQRPDPNAPGQLLETLEVGIVRSGRVPLTADLTTGAMEVRADEVGLPEVVTERVALLPETLTSPYRFLLLLPFAWESPWAGAMGLHVSLERLPASPGRRQMKAFGACVDDLMRQREILLAVQGTDDQWAGCLLSLDQLVWPSHWRRALVYLTGTVDADLAQDMALGASPSIAQTLAHRIHATHAASPVRDRKALVWLVEKTAYQVLLELAQNDELTPAFSTYLLRHAGQLGRQCPTLGEQLAAANDLADFQSRLVNENRISLEDMSPAARSRAYNWLKGKGQAPANYDPLGTTKERRDALRAAQEQGGPADV